MTVVGARPQFIKAAVVIRALANREGVCHVLVHTGQHYDDNMSNVFFVELSIPVAQYDLGIGSANHGAQTGRMLEAIETVMLSERPDCVIVYGDTNSTVAGALAAVKLHIPVVHVEAGLRSHNRRMPEEINRIVTDHISDLLLAPTTTAVTNLLREGIGGDKVHLVGDVMYDATVYFGREAESTSTVLLRQGLLPRKYILATVHREENTSDLFRLTSILEALSIMSEEMPVVIPLHPRTRVAISREGLTDFFDGNMTALEPLSYMDMLVLERNSAVIVTDSGGVQKEAFFHRVPCVTVRDETEWVELVDSGWNLLVSPQGPNQVVDAIRNALRERSRAEINPYGDGFAAQRIADLISDIY